MGDIWLVRICVFCLCLICCGAVALCVALPLVGHSLPTEIPVIAVTASAKLALVLIYMQRRNNGDNRKT